MLLISSFGMGCFSALFPCGLSVVFVSFSCSSHVSSRPVRVYLFGHSIELVMIEVQRKGHVKDLSSRQESNQFVHEHRACIVISHTRQTLHLE